MGSALVRASLAASDEVTVWNRTSARADPLVAEGARLAATPAEAIAASPVTIVCVGSHYDTRSLLDGVSDHLKNRVIVDLSTGSADDAEALAADLEAAGARWQIGMINTYPRDIAADHASVFCVGPTDVWEDIAGRIRILGPKSEHVGTEAGLVAALFAAMFTTRQGYMCGMLHGAAVAHAAGLSAEAYAKTLPISVGMAESYSETFRRTVVPRRYEDPGASISTYLAAFDDTLATFRKFGADDGLPEFMAGLVRRGVEAGLGDKELTALYLMLTGQTGAAR